MMNRYYIKDNQVVDIVEHNDLKNENYGTEYDVIVGNEETVLKYLEKYNIIINKIAS